MATNIVKAALLKVQDKVDAMFSQDSPYNFPFKEPTKTASALFANNFASANPLQDQNGKYRQVEVNWTQRGNLTPAYDGDGTTPSLTLPVDLSEGKGPVSDSKLYDNNVVIQEVVELEDTNFSTSVLDVPDEVARRIAHAMLTLRYALNTRAINFFSVNRSTVNEDPSLPQGVTYAGGIFDVDSSFIDMQHPRGLTDIDAIAQNNLITSYFMVNGRYHWYNSKVDSDYRRENDNEREYSRFSEIDADLYFDIKRMDAVLGNRNTFVVSKGSYVAWDYVHTSEISRDPKQYQDNAWQYFIEDPQLMILDNGRLRPVRYPVYYQRVPVAGNTKTFVRGYVHRWEVSFNGGLYPAPPSESGNTGILHLQSTAGV